MELADSAAPAALVIRSRLPHPFRMAAPELRLGTDIVDVRSVEASIERFGRRYLERVYTDAEIAYCCAEATGGAERFAARFAAKEATLKVLRPSDWRPEWRHIEVVRQEGGWCEINLRGRAAALAAEQGVQIVSCSLAHERSYATAVVLGARTIPSTDSFSSPDHA
jgi:holo-[acyl-carrier protein] synthase